MRYVATIIKQVHDERAPTRYVFDLSPGAIVIGGQPWMGSLDILVPITVWDEPIEEQDEEDDGV